MGGLSKMKKDVKSNIENKIKKCIENDSASFIAFQIRYIPFEFREIEDFMLIMRQRYSDKVSIHWIYDFENFTIDVLLEKH